jgi:hypothetical protein
VAAVINLCVSGVSNVLKAPVDTVVRYRRLRMSKGAEEVKKLMEMAKEETGLPSDGNPYELIEMIIHYARAVTDTDPLQTDALINLAVSISAAAYLWAVVANDEIYDEDTPKWTKRYILSRDSSPLRLVDN